MTSPATDPRAARSREAILAAAFDLLAREGPGAITHQRVAQQAGVGRATVYRHWAAPEDLLRDVLFSAELPFFATPALPLRSWLHAQRRQRPTAPAHHRNHRAARRRVRARRRRRRTRHRARRGPGRRAPDRPAGLPDHPASRTGTRPAAHRGHRRCRPPAATRPGASARGHSASGISDSLARFPARPGGSSRPGPQPAGPRPSPTRGSGPPAPAGSPPRLRHRNQHRPLPARPHRRRPGNLTLLEPRVQQAGPPRAQRGHFSRISIMIPATPWRLKLANIRGQYSRAKSGLFYWAPRPFPAARFVRMSARMSTSERTIPRLSEPISLRSPHSMKDLLKAERGCFARCMLERH